MILITGFGTFGGESEFKGRLRTPCEPLGDAIIFKNHDFGHWIWDFFGERAILKENWGHLVKYWVMPSFFKNRDFGHWIFGGERI